MKTLILVIALLAVSAVSCTEDAMAPMGPGSEMEEVTPGVRSRRS